jgi:4a-hydroxytetrahydrobiopterin dehydratase
MTSPLLPQSEVAIRLNSLPGWELKDNALFRTLTFTDFKAAFAFMTAAALVSEQQNHHPNWQNCYNTVSIALNTHDSGGITERDFQWALAITPFIP